MKVVPCHIYIRYIGLILEISQMFNSCEKACSTNLLKFLLMRMRGLNLGSLVSLTHAVVTDIVGEYPYSFIFLRSVGEY